MRKPSMFSREYSRKMRRRRKQRNLIIFLTIIIALFLSVKLLFDNYMKNERNKVKNENISEQQQSTENSSSQQETQTNTETQTQQPEQPQVVVPQDKSLDVTLAEGKTVKIVLQESEGTQRIKEVIGDAAVISSYNVNPSKNKAVVISPAQDMYTIDISGAVKDITKKTYVSKKNGSTLKKEIYLASKKDFLWHSTPKFINDNTIIYVSQMPWFKNTKYIWKATVEDNQHGSITGIEGNDIILGEITEKGVAITIDGTTKYVNSEGKVIE